MPKLHAALVGAASALLASLAQYLDHLGALGLASSEVKWVVVGALTAALSRLLGLGLRKLG